MFTMEISSTKFHDIKLIWINDIYKAMVHKDITKLPMDWSSNVPKRYKRNPLFGDLLQSKSNVHKFRCRGQLYHRLI